MTSTQWFALALYTYAVGAFGYLWGAYREWSAKQDLIKSFRQERKEWIKLLDSVGVKNASSRSLKQAPKRGNK